MYLLVDIDKCTGCRICELACSFRWSKTFNPAEAAIHVVKDDYKSLNIPVVCQQCSKPVCRDVCPSGAINIDPKIGILTIDELKCRGCKMCITSCPFGAISFVSTGTTTEGVARKCDLCNLNPECIKFCAYDAIELIKEEKISNKLKRKKLKYFTAGIKQGEGIQGILAEEKLQ